MFLSKQRWVQTVALDSIKFDSCVRSRPDPSVVSGYAHAMKLNISFPPISVISDGNHLWLVDGLHRALARRENGETTVLAEMREGTFEDAVWESCAANKKHGLRRSNADKRLCVVRALSHARGASLSNRQIAVHCGVHHHSVGRIRSELEQSGELCQMESRTARRGESIYAISVDGVTQANRARSRHILGTVRAIAQKLEQTETRLNEALKCVQTILEQSAEGQRTGVDALRHMILNALHLVESLAAAQGSEADLGTTNRSTPRQIGKTSWPSKSGEVDHARTTASSAPS